MALTPAQLKSPFKSVSARDYTTYIARVFEQGDLDGMKAFADSGALAKAMAAPFGKAGWQPTDHGAYVVNGFLSAVVKGRIGEQDARAWWDQLWNMGAHNRTDLHAQWLCKVAWLPLADLMVEQGVSPHSEPGDRQSKQSPFNTLFYFILKNQYQISHGLVPRKDLVEQIWSRVERWWAAPGVTPDALNEGLTTVARLAYNNILRNRDTEGLDVWRKRFLEAGASPFRVSREQCAFDFIFHDMDISLKPRQKLDWWNSEGSAFRGHTSEETQVLFDNWHADKLDSEGRRIMDWAQDLTEVTSASQPVKSQELVSLHSWRKLLVVAGNEKVLENLAKWGLHPFGLTEEGLGSSRKNVSVLVHGNDKIKRAGGVWQGLATLAKAGAKPDAAWVEKAVGQWIQADMITGSDANHPVSGQDWLFAGEVCNFKENGVPAKLARDIQQWIGGAGMIGYDDKESEAPRSARLRSLLLAWQEIGLLEHLLPGDELEDDNHSNDDLRTWRGWGQVLCQGGCLEILDTMTGVAAERLRAAGGQALAWQHNRPVSEKTADQLLGWQDLSQTGSALLGQALKNNSPQLIQRLLDRNVEFEMPHWREVLDKALARRHMELDYAQWLTTLESLVARGLDPNAGARKDRPLSLLVERHAPASLFKELVELGADVTTCSMPKDDNQTEGASWLRAARARALEASLSESTEIAPNHKSIGLRL